MDLRHLEPLCLKEPRAGGRARPARRAHARQLARPLPRLAVVSCAPARDSRSRAFSRCAEQPPVWLNVVVGVCSGGRASAGSFGPDNAHFRSSGSHISRHPLLEAANAHFQFRWISISLHSLPEADNTHSLTPGSPISRHPLLEAGNAHFHANCVFVELRSTRHRVWMGWYASYSYLSRLHPAADSYM